MVSVPRFARRTVEAVLHVPARRALLLASVASAVLVWAWVVSSPGSGWDAHVYWSTSLSHPYTSSVAGLPGAYLYSPAFRQAIAPLTVLPWPAFHAIWVGLLLCAIVLLAGPFAILLLVNPIVLFELQAGNIHTLLAVAIVAGFRYPAAWAFVLLTKVTPGVGILWYLVRREWRNLAVAVVATALVAGVSFLLAPAQWVDWLRSLVANAVIPTGDYTGSIFGPLWLRAPLAVGIIDLGGADEPALDGAGRRDGRDPVARAVQPHPPDRSRPPRAAAGRPLPLAMPG